MTSRMRKDQALDAHVSQSRVACSSSLSASPIHVSSPTHSPDTSIDTPGPQLSGFEDVISALTRRVTDMEAKLDNDTTSMIARSDEILLLIDQNTTSGDNKLDTAIQSSETKLGLEVKKLEQRLDRIDTKIQAANKERDRQYDELSNKLEDLLTHFSVKRRRLEAPVEP